MAGKDLYDASAKLASAEIQLDAALKNSGEQRQTAFGIIANFTGALSLGIEPTTIAELYESARAELPKIKEVVDRLDANTDKTFASLQALGSSFIDAVKKGEFNTDPTLAPHIRTLGENAYLGPIVRDDGTLLEDRNEILILRINEMESETKKEMQVITNIEAVGPEDVSADG